MTETPSNTTDSPIPVPTNGNGKTLKYIWSVLGFILTIFVGSVAATSWVSNNYVSKEVYGIERKNDVDERKRLSESIDKLADKIITYLGGGKE